MSIFNISPVLHFSGLQWKDIQACVRWMKPYAVTLAKEGSTTTLPHSSGSPHSSGLNKAVPNIVTDDSHNIQTHSVNLDMLVSLHPLVFTLFTMLDLMTNVLFVFQEQAQALLSKLAEDDEVKALGLLTPPSSGCKPLVSSHGSNFT